MSKHLLRRALFAAALVGTGTATVAGFATNASATTPDNSQHMTSCSGDFTAQILTGKLAPLALHGRLVLSNGSDGKALTGMLATHNDVTGEPVSLATVTGTAKGDMVELRFETDNGKVLTGNAKASDLGTCTNLKGTLKVKGGGTGVWATQSASTSAAVTYILTPKELKRACGSFKGTIIFSDNSSLDCTTGEANIPEAK